jgi:hypothetical protein
MMKASVSPVLGIAATFAVLITTPVAAQLLRLDNPYGWIDRLKAESAAKWRAELAERRQRDQETKQEAERSAQEIERERLKAGEAEQHAAEARKRYAAEAAATTKRGLQFSLFSFRSGGAKSKDGRIAKLSSQSEPQSSALHNRDPDGIYQFGQQVGTVELPLIDERKSKVFFQRIVGAMNLNNGREFEYRKYVLRIRGELGETTSDLSGQRNRALFAVQCDIVGPASTASTSR